MRRGIDIDDIYVSLVSYINRLTGTSENVRRGLVSLVEKLVELNKIRAVSLNHSIMELLVAKYLMDLGYERVDIEVKIDDLLVADVVGYKEALVVVEIETGFVPVEYASEPLSYLKARLASKIARYSSRADMFVLAFPSYYIPPIPRVLLRKPSERDPATIKELKALVDRYYRNPPIEYDLIARAYLHKLYVLNIDEGAVIDLSPEDLLEVYEATKRVYTNTYTNRSGDQNQGSLGTGRYVWIESLLA